VTAKQRVDHEINSVTDLRNALGAIRAEVEQAATRDDLKMLYRRAGILVTLTSSTPWRRKFGLGADEMRRVAEEEFAKTASAINERAAAIGTKPDYDETWGR
jgi:hypothetical protein